MIVWIASYPRSGNTLLRMLLHQAFGITSYSQYNDATDIGKNEELRHAVGHATFEKAQWQDFYTQVQQCEHTTYIKTHDRPSDEAKAIYVARDGRAAVASYWRYLVAYGRHHAPSLAEVIMGAVSFGAWSDHVTAWRPASRPHTLLLKYEDLVSTPEREIERIGDFLSVPVVGSACVSFEHLNRQFPNFFRRGANDPNIADFSPSQAALFALLHEEAMSYCGYTLADPFVPSPDQLDAALRDLQRDLSKQVAHWNSRLAHATDLAEIRRRKVRGLERQNQAAQNKLTRKNSELSHAANLAEIRRRKMHELERQSQSAQDKLTAANRQLEKQVQALREVLAVQEAELLRLRSPVKELLRRVIGPRGGKMTVPVRSFVARARASGRRRVAKLGSRVTPPSTLVPPALQVLPPQPDAAEDIRQFGIAIFGYNRARLVESVLTSLGHQRALNRVHVFIDGDQGRPDLRSAIDKVADTVAKFPIRKVHRHRGHLGFRKIMLHAMDFMAAHYEGILFLEDDCFPTRDCVETMRADLNAIEERPDVFSVYGHHFGVPGEGCFGRFQGWGWATTAAKLTPILEELRYWYHQDEVAFLKFTHAALTDEILQKIDVTPGRQPSLTLRKFFAWDETLCLLTAQRSMNHMRSSKRVIFNCGASPDSAHFHNIDRFRAPPFNMVSPEEAWSHF